MTTTTDTGTDVTPEDIAALESLLSQSQIALEDLNAYFGEVDEYLLTEEEEAAQAEAEAMQVSLSSSLEQLTSFYRELKQGGHVGRSDAAMLKGVSISTESMQGFFNRYPLNSFTETPSKVNYQATCEGLGSAIVDTLIRLIKRVWELVKTFASAIFRLLTGRKAQDVKADALDKAVNQRYSRDLVGQLSGEQIEKLSEQLGKPGFGYTQMTVALMGHSDYPLGMNYLRASFTALEADANELIDMLDGKKPFSLIVPIVMGISPGIPEIDSRMHQHVGIDQLQGVFASYCDYYDKLLRMYTPLKSVEDLNDLHDYVEANRHVDTNKSIATIADLIKRIEKALEAAARRGAKQSTDEKEDGAAVNAVTQLRKISSALGVLAQARLKLAQGRDTMSKINAFVYDMANAN